MTLEAAHFLQSGSFTNASRAASLRSAPVQLREGVHTFLSLAAMHPDLHPAVLAAILARPASERRSLLEAARASAGSKLASSSCATGKLKLAAGSAETLSSDSDEVWEDAVEDLDSAAKKQRGEAVDMATVVVGGNLELLERQTADWQRAWQSTRQLGAWTRYNECRKKPAELRGRERRQAKQDQQQDEERAQQAAKWSQLEALKEVHEKRLSELNRRRERLRLSRQYHEQTRLHHAQLAQAQLQEQLRQLEERQQLRRLQHLQRVQQLVAELAAPERGDLKPAAAVTSSSSVTSATSAPSTPSPEPDDVFTHMWDDFSLWEKMVDDDKDSVKRPAAPRAPLANQPDVIPVMPASAAGPAGASVWRHNSVSGDGHPQGGAHAARRHSVAADGFQERKKWFEEALLSWHAQDEEEDFGTSLYASSSSPLPPTDGSSGRGSRADSGCGRGHASPWQHDAWPTWTVPATATTSY